MAAPTKNGSGDSSIHPPPVKWAQRRDKVLLSVGLENCKNYKHAIEEQTFYFRGKGGTDKLDHEVTLELFAAIDKENSKVQYNDREVFFVLFKKDSNASYWPRLTKEQKKLHFLKTDFNRWMDEDDSEDEEKEDFNLDEMMSSMGGLNGSDLGASPDGEEEDSDDEDLPDLQ